jgi:hypothetical protein
METCSIHICMIIIKFNTIFQKGEVKDHISYNSWDQDHGMLIIFNLT